MVIATMDIGKMTKQMVMEYIFIQTEQNTLVNGKMINNMAMVNRNGLMEKSMKESTKKDLKQEKES